MIVTIDGPAGAGKSTVAQALAQRLGFEFLDTGAMYRLATLAALDAGLSADSPALPRFVASLTIDVQSGGARLNGADVSHRIRTPEVTAAVRAFADVPALRQDLSARQRAFACGRNVVTEGRDQGTVVFPDAECKFFLVADAAERARRRAAQLADAGHDAAVEEVRRHQDQRDDSDAARPIGGLRPADDAIWIDSTGLDVEGVLLAMEAAVRSAASARTAAGNAGE